MKLEYRCSEMTEKTRLVLSCGRIILLPKWKRMKLLVIIIYPTQNSKTTHFNMHRGINYCTSRSNTTLLPHRISSTALKMIDNCDTGTSSNHIQEARERLRMRIISHLLSSDNANLVSQPLYVIEDTSSRIEAEVFKAASSSSKCLELLEEYTNCDSKLLQERLSNVSRLMISRIRRKRRNSTGSIYRASNGNIYPSNRWRRGNGQS